jgi:GTPase KRas protein
LFKFTKPFFRDQFNYCENDTFCRSCVIDNEVALIDVTDTTGQEEHSYPAKIHQFGIRAAGFILVYRVSSLQSFKGITDLHHAIWREKDKDNFPTVIVGIQCLQESLREVTTQKGEKLARDLGCTFFEIDADSRAEVDAVFFDLVREVRRYRRNVFRYR